MKQKFNYNGYSFFEKIKLWKNLDKLNFISVFRFPNKEIFINENTIFTGKHFGNMTVSENVHFIFRGNLSGKMIISKHASLDFFGELIGVLNSEADLFLRKKSSVNGKIFCNNLKFEKGAKIIGRLVSFEGKHLT